MRRRGGDAPSQTARNPIPASDAYPDCVAAPAFLSPDPRLRREAIDARRSLLARALRGPAGRAFVRADIAGMRMIRSTARSRRATRAIVVFSRAGEHGALWIATGAAGMALDRDRRERWAVGLTAVATAYLANTAIKQVARRPRPQLRDLPPLIPTPTQLSFPSSHSASSFAAATAYAGLLPRGPLLATASAMALSRIHLGVHYPTDIAVGAGLGCVVGTTVRRIGDRVIARRAADRDVPPSPPTDPSDPEGPTR